MTMPVTTNATDHDHKQGRPHVWNEGCCLCDARTELLALASGETELPTWVAETGAFLYLIRTIRSHYEFRDTFVPEW